MDFRTVDDRMNPQMNSFGLHDAGISFLTDREGIASFTRQNELD